MDWRLWLRRALLGLGLLVAVAVSVPASAIAPRVRDDLALDRVVVAVALDWRDFGYDEAWERLRYELDRRRIGTQVRDEDCSLSTEADETRRVHCAWQVEVALPLTERTWTLSFESTARIDRRGVLLR